MSMTQAELAKIAAQILAAFIASDDDLDDVDRTVDMAAYMAKRLVLAVDAPLTDLQACVWPDSIEQDHEIQLAPAGPQVVAVPAVVDPL